MVSDAGGRGHGPAAGMPVAIGLIDAEAGALGVLGRDFREADEQSAAAHRRHVNLLHGLGARRTAHVPGVWGPFKDAVFPGYWMHEAGQSISGTALDAVLKHHPASPGSRAARFTPETANESCKSLNRKAPAFAAARHIVPDWLGNRAPLGDGKVRALVTGVGPGNRRARPFWKPITPRPARWLCRPGRSSNILNSHGYAIDRVWLWPAVI